MTQDMSAVNNLLSALHEIVNYEPMQLVQKEKLGHELDFSGALYDFQNINQVCDTLLKVSLDKIPKAKINKILGHTNAIIDTYKKILAFSITANNVNDRNTYISQVEQRYQLLFDEVSPVLAFDLRSNRAYIEHQNTLKNIRNESVSVITELKEIKEKSTEEIKYILENIRNTAAEVGVSKHAIHFTTEANYHKEMSKRWLFVTIVIGMLTIAWGVFGYKLLPQPDIDGKETTVELLKNFSSKLIVLSILSYVLVWSARNFNANRHNFIVNQHRQNALSTFETFVQAAGGDIDIKNAILLQATSSIFSSQPTGYINKEPDGAASSSKVVEVVRTATAAANATNKVSQ